MGMIDYIEIGLLILLMLVLLALFANNTKLKKENKLFSEIIITKNTTITNLEASRVAVQDVIENFSISDEVMAEINDGKSREEVSQKLGIPVNRIELIIKFDKLKKEQKHA